jgi:hypothetical protein
MARHQHLPQQTDLKGTGMDLIERYVTAVRWMAPSAQRDDIAAELRDVLLSRREEKEHELGRPLTRKEEASLLKDFGHPLVVAARYGRHQYLVGPDLYPFFLVVLAITLAAMWGAVLIGAVVTAAVSGHPPNTGGLLGTLWDGGLAALGGVTLAFAVIQRTGWGAHRLTNWDPADLPSFATRKRLRRPKWAAPVEHVAGIAFGVIFLLWWTGVIELWRPVIPVEPSGVLIMALAPVWLGLYWPVVGLASLGIATHAVGLVVGERRWVKALDILRQAAVGSLAAVLLFRGGPLVTVTGTGLPPSALTGTTYGVNLGLQISLVVMICVCSLSILTDLWRLWRGPRETL